MADASTRTTSTCGTYVSDNYAKQVDSDTWKNFVTGNSPAILTAATLTALTDYETTLTNGGGTAYLYARYRIETTCTKACNDFRFKSKTSFTSMNTIWDTFYYVCWVAGLGCCACILGLLYIVLYLKLRAPTDYYWYLLLLTEILCVYLLFSCWRIYSSLTDSTTGLGTLLTNASAASTGSCLPDKDWAKVLTDYIAMFSTASMANWICVWMLGLVAAICGGVYVYY